MSASANDRIEGRLREDARQPVPDNGFSHRVLEALPPPPTTRPWLRPALVLGSAAIGGILAWRLAPTGTSLLQGFVDLARLQSQTPSAIMALGMALAMAVTAAVLASEVD